MAKSGIEEKTMRARGIDHLVLAVRDLEATRQVYSRLGFTCTPTALHPWGTANFLVQLQGSFLEVLAVDRPDLLIDPGQGEFSFGRFNEAFLKEREGFSMLVLESRDRDADLVDFKSRGLETYPPFGFSRQAKLPSGEEVTVSFSLAFVRDAIAPKIGFFTCQQHAPEYFWKSEYQSHANSAQKVGEVVMVSPHPAKHKAFLEGFSGAQETKVTPDHVRIQTPRGALSVITPRQAEADWGAALASKKPDEPYLAGYSIESENLDKVREILNKSGLSCKDKGDHLIVASELVFGAAILFRQMG